MNILYVIPYFNPRRGGEVNVCYNLSKYLSMKNHRVTILTSDFEFDHAFSNSLNNVEVIHFPCLANIALFLYSPKINNWLKINIENYDIIHLHAFRTYQNISASVFSGKHNVPYVLQAHGSIRSSNEKKNLKRIYDTLWGNKLLRNASSILALTEREANDCISIGCNINKIRMLSNGVDLYEYSNLPERGTFRRRYGINDTDRIVLYLGRLNKYKGIDLLISAFSDIRLKNNEVKLVIVGPDDGFKAHLDRLVRDLKLERNVLFTGPLFGPEKLAAYIDSDIFVISSLEDCFPITVLEACACGLPIIGTKGNEIADMIDGNVGRIIEYDKDQLADSIMELLYNNALYSLFSENGKKLILNKFNWEKIVFELEEIYKEVIMRVSI